VFLLLSKVFDLLLSPLSWALLLLGAAALLRRRPRLGWAAASAAGAVLLVFSCDPVADGLARALERSAVRTDRPEVTYDAVIVLGGIVEGPPTRATGELQLSGGAERLTRGFDVVRTGHARHLLYSCGLSEPGPGDVAESTLAVRQLEAWGIAPERLVAEDRSRNTRENAVESARIVRERGWTRLLLVTSAAHMERSLGCFRAVGLAPDALPVDFRGGDGRLGSWLPRAGNLSKSTDLLRELAGRVVYRVMGYSAP
jgi:uncharacterized SAM-binding protein YcdF (DUF218 family)